jgi:hypothetical protein
MNALSKASVLLLSSLLLLLSGCMEPKTPEDAARYFWKAMQNRNAEGAQKLAIDGSAAKLLDKLKPQTFELGQVDSNGNRATIQTTLTQLNGTQTQEVLLTTVLFYQNETWRVSIKQTEASLLPGALKKLFRNLEEIGNQLGDKLGASLNETVQEALPVIEDMVQKGFKELEDGIEIIPSDPEGAQPAPQRLPKDEVI